MAQIAITLVSGAVKTVDSATTVPTPDGPKAAGDLVVGEFIALFSDSSMAVEIETIEEA